MENGWPFRKIENSDIFPKDRFFREVRSEILFQFSKPTRNLQINTKIQLFVSLHMQTIIGKLTKFLVFSLKQFIRLEHGINLALSALRLFYLTIGSF